jgi:signal transduction histidine kinase
MAPMRRGGVRGTVAAVAAAVLAAFGGVALSLWAVVQADGSLVDSVLSGAVVTAFAVVGAVVVAARPDNRVGWLMLVGGTLWSLGNAGVDLGRLGIVVDPGRVPAASLCAVAGSAVRGLGWYTVTIGVPLFFPDGSLVDRRWRWVPRLLVLVMVGAVVDPLTDPRADLVGFGAWHNPFAPAGSLGLISAAAFLASVPLSLVVAGAAVAQLVVRWRRGDAVRRQQVLLLAIAAALTVLAVPIAFIDGGGWIFSASALPLPFAIGFAVLARGLYDLRTAVNRSLLWLTLSAVVAGAYAVVIAGVGALLHVDGAPWLPWVAAAVVAVTFAPLRDGLQRAVNRLTYGRWDEPYDVLAALGQRLEGSADVERLLADVATELHGLGLRDVVVRDADGRVLAGEPAQVAPGADLVDVPLSAYGRPVGTLRYRQPLAALRARDARLLDDLAGHLGGVVHAHRLTADLERARESLVLAREEERRRLRRDLHDGLGPALAGHLLRLDVLAGKLGPRSPARADAEALREDLRATVLDIRRLVEGLRPPALDELGLAGALGHVVQRLTAGTGVVVDLRVADLPPLAAAVEVATFRIVSEAVTNVVRHAAARRCEIDVAVSGGALRVRVSDDGNGRNGSLPGAGGNGLQTMRERAEELRGTLRVSEDGGTTVVAEIPVRQDDRPRAHVAVGDR